MPGVDAIQFLAEMVRIPSVSLFADDGSIIRRNYKEVAELIAKTAKEAGLLVEVVDLLNGEVPTLLIMLPEAPNRPSLAFVTHYDVVPARGPWRVEGREVDPFEPVITEKRVYGRGAADDKSAIAAVLSGLAELVGEAGKLRYNPVLVVTGDEEVGGVGVKALLQRGYRWDRVIIVDSGSEYVSVGASGVVAGWVKVRGKSGHAGYPFEARNAAEDLVELLHALREFKEQRAKKISSLPAPPGGPVARVWGRFSITILKLPPSEPEKHNRIPGEAWAGFDMRLIPEESLEEALGELFSAFSAAVARTGVNASLEVFSAQRGWFTKNEEFKAEVLEAARRAYRACGLQGEVGVAAELGGNDGTFFDEYGMDVIAFGTIRSGTNIHSEGEFVYVEDIEMYKRFVRELLLR